MAAKSTATAYGSVAVAIHWTTAVLIFFLLGSGLYIADEGEDAPRALLAAHVISGNLVLLLTLFRIFWWWRADRQPADVAGLPRWQRIAAHAVHGLLYVVILVMATSGIGMIALSGAAPAIFSGTGELPDFSDYLPRIPHGIGARLMMALLVAHIGAALYHHFIRRDGLLARMGIGRVA